MTEKEAHISVRDLTMAYGDFVLMRDLTFTINRGDIFIIMGGSGCGKSTMMTILIGLKAPAKGKVLYGEIDFWGADQQTRDRIIRRAGVMYQSGALWSSMTLAENIALPLETYTDLSPGQIREVVKLKLALVGMAGFEEFYPSEISGGMQKRAGIARAMALDPEVLFFDEPSAGLDPVSARRLDDLILELRESLGTTMVIVTHELASIFAHRLPHLFFGGADPGLYRRHPAAALRGPNLCGRFGGHCHGAPDGSDYDRHRHGRPHGGRLRGAAGDHAGEPGD